MKKVIGLFLIILSFSTVAYSQRPSVTERPSQIVTKVKTSVNETADSSYTVIDVLDYNHFGIQQIASGGIRARYFITMDEAASATDTSSTWINAGEYFLETDSLSILNPRIIKYSAESFLPKKIMIYNQNLDDANQNDIWFTQW